MSRKLLIAYTLMLCLPACIGITGCSNSQDPAQSSSATSSDTTLPDVQVPGEDSGDASSSATDG